MMRRIAKTKITDPEIDNSNNFRRNLKRFPFFRTLLPILARAVVWLAGVELELISNLWLGNVNCWLLRPKVGSSLEHIVMVSNFCDGFHQQKQLFYFKTYLTLSRWIHTKLDGLKTSEIKFWGKLGFKIFLFTIFCRF